MLVGDETSVAVAAALEVERPGLVSAVLHADDEAAARAAAESVGLRRVDVVPRDDARAAAERVVERRASAPDATVALTGGAPWVVATREALRAKGVEKVKTKTYWVPSKTGLD